MNETLQRAETISRLLTHIKRLQKMLHEIDRLLNGRGSLIYSFLQLTDEQIDKAHTEACKDLDDTLKQLEELL